MDTSNTTKSNAEWVTMAGDLHLLDLPDDALHRIFCDFLSTASDRFSLQCTNKKFQEISNSVEMKKALQILPPLKDASECTDADPSNSGALDTLTFDATSTTSTVTRTTSNIQCFLPDDTSMVATQRFLPFAQAGNPDALFLMGLIAAYVEDDLHCGLALFATSLNNNNNNNQTSQLHARSMFELGITLRRRSHFRDYGQQIIEQTADSFGHAHALLTTRRGPLRPQYAALLQAAREEARTTSAMIGLQNLLDKKPEPPHQERLKVERCSHPPCNRAGYYTRRRAARHWVKNKGFTSAGAWEECRAGILAGCARTGVEQLPEDINDDIYCVPSFFGCNSCGETLYCSRACQVMHWRDHKVECQHLAGARFQVHLDRVRALAQMERALGQVGQMNRARDLAQMLHRARIRGERMQRVLDDNGVGPVAVEPEEDQDR